MDKNKIIEAAAKLVAKGAYDKAIKEYQRILDADAKDVRILQKMGELYQKKNDNTQAAGYFTKVAESYATDGFFLKAVALYKQVLKLDPSLVEVNLKLAELHQQLQLMSEAMAYYQLVVNHYDKVGDARRSLDTLKRMVDLDPENVASRIKLAELYAREQMNGEAADEFRRAAEHLKRNNRVDDYLRVAERISTLEPGNLGLARELAETYLQRGDQKRALAKLQICFKADGRDVETLRLLAQAFQGLGQTSKTISVFKELTKLYEETGRADDAEQIWRQIEALDPHDPDVVHRRAAAAPVAPPPAPVRAAPQPSTQRFPAASPMPPPAAPPAAAPAAPGLGKLLTETDVYVKYGLHDKALEHLRKVFAIDPENIDAHEKAYQIYLAANNQAQAGEQLLNVLRLHTRRGDAQRAQPFLQAMLQGNPGHPEVPAFLAALRMAGTAGAAAQDEVSDDAILVDASDDEIIVADEPGDALEQDQVRSAELQLPEAGEGEGAYELEPPLADEPLASPGGWEFDPSSEPQTSESEQGSPPGEGWGGNAVVAPVPPSFAPTSQVPAYQLDDEPTAEPDAAAELAAQAIEQGEDEVIDESASVGDSFDDDTTNNLAADAVEAAAYQVANSWEGQSPELADDEATAVELPPEQAEEAQWAQEEAVPAPLDSPEAYSVADDTPTPAGGVEMVEEPVEAPPEDEPALEECDEADFFLEQGLLEEAQEIIETIQIAYPGHRRAGELAQKLEAKRAALAGPAEGAGNGVAHEEGHKDAFDLAAELASELGDLGTEQAPPEPAASEDFQVSAADVLSAFKKGLEKVVKPEDVETHYDLGIAYKEMGLIDDAVGEFSVARQGCVGKKKEIDCLSMIATMEIQKGDYPVAVDALRQSLRNPNAVGEVEKAVRYELATAHELAGSLGRSLWQYLKVQGLDGSYREVQQQVERLSSMVEPEDDEAVMPPDPKRQGGASRKVGYL